MALSIPKLPAKYLIPQFILAHFSHHVSTGVLIPLLPQLREGFGLNYFQAGVLVSSFSLSYGFGQVPIAILGDRFGHRPLIVYGMIGTSMAGIGVSCTQAFWQMVLCFIAMGLFGATYHAPSTSFISQVLPPERRGRVLGMHFIGGPASFLLTPAMAIGIAHWFQSWRSSFFILALPVLFASGLLWFAMEEPKGDRDEKKKTSKGIGGESFAGRADEARISWFQIVRAIGILMGLGLSMQIIFASVNSYLPLYMVDRHHISPKWAGLVVSVIAGIGIVGAPFGGGLSDRFGRKWVILFSLSLCGPLLLAVTKSPFGIPLLFSLILYGLVMSVRMPTMESLIADVVPIRQRTTALSVYFFLGMETAGFTTPIVGHLIDAYGSNVVFHALGIGMCMIAAVAWLFRKKI